MVLVVEFTHFNLARALMMARAPPLETHVRELL